MISGSRTQAGLSGTACLCSLGAGWTHSCSCTQLWARLGWRTQEGSLQPFCWNHICWITLVLLLLASPQETSTWFPILRTLSLQQDGLGFSRVAKVKAEVTKSLKVWVWKFQNLPSAAFNWSEQIPRSCQIQEVRKKTLLLWWEVVRMCRLGKSCELSSL